MPSIRTFVIEYDCIVNQASFFEGTKLWIMNEILEKVAEMNGVSVEEVKTEMQKAIHDAAKNPSPEFKSRFGDREPDISEFLEMLSSQVTKRMGN